MESNKSHLSHPNLVVTKYKGVATKQRKIYQVSGVACPDTFAVHNASINNMERAVLERVFFVKENGVQVKPPTALPNIFNERLGYIQTYLAKHVPSTNPIGYQQFADSYKARKHTVYQKAVDSLMLSGVTSADAHLKVFGKPEKCNISKKPDPIMRVVSPRDPRYNVEVGRYLKPLEKRLFKGIDSLFGEPTIIKGYTAEQSGKIIHDKWKQYKHPVAIMLDATRWDQHIGQQALSWEHNVYVDICRSKRLAKLLSWQLTNHCRSYCNDGKLRYVVAGGRMSGDMNTSLGNCLLMSSMVHAFMTQMNVGQFSLCNNGDDCVVIFEKSKLLQVQHKIHWWFYQMGINMKIDGVVCEFEQIEFCQTQPVYCDGEYVMVRNPYQSISKDAISLKPLNSKSIYDKWVGAVGDAGISLTGGIPVLQDYYNAYTRATIGQKRLKNDPTMASGLFLAAEGMHRKYKAVSAHTRYSFWLAFGITPDNQLLLESYYSNIDLSFTKLQHSPVCSGPVNFMVSVR